MPQDWEDDSNLKDSWEDEFEEETAPPQKPVTQQQPIVPSSTANQKRTTQLEDDFFSSLDLNTSIKTTAPATFKKPSINMEAITAELERKKRLEKAVMDADLENAQDLFGTTIKSAASKPKISTAQKTWEEIKTAETEQEFAHLSTMIMAKLALVAKEKNFGKFIGDLTKQIVTQYPVAATATQRAKVVVPAAKTAAPVAAKGPAAKKTAVVSLSGSSSRKKDMDFDLNDYENLSSDEYSE